jgi:hypothetical protein
MNSTKHMDKRVAAVRSNQIVSHIRQYHLVLLLESSAN